MLIPLSKKKNKKKIVPICILNHTSFIHAILFLYKKQIIKHLIEKLDIMSVLNKQKLFKHMCAFENIYLCQDQILVCNWNWFWLFQE